MKLKGTSRSEKILKNLMFGAGAQMIQTMFPFITRTIFIYTLGEMYLGISSLFTNILTVLSMAELGLGNVLVYSLYKPLAEKDNKKVASLIAFYKNLYRGIAAVVLSIGLLLIPFLKYIIKLPDNVDHILLYYVLYVLNSALSYLFVYKASVINADQKQYIVSTYRTIGIICQNIVQAVVLLVFKNFLAYLCIQILATLLLNFSLSRKADCLYSLGEKNIEPISKEEKQKIFLDTKAMLAYRIGGTILNSTDSIFISGLISTVTVGFYTNYVTLEGIINKFINLVYDAMYASVGNLNATETSEKKKKVFDALVLIFMWVGTVAFVGFFNASDDVIRLWIGEKYCVDRFSVFAFCTRLYLPIILYPIWMYRNTTGIFKETQNVLIYAGVLNIILSWILGVRIGLAGVLLATSIARLVTSFWFEPVVLYKKVFVDSSVREYFAGVFFSVVISAFSMIVVYFVIQPVNILIIRLLIEVVLSILIPSCIYFLRYRKKEEYIYLKKMVVDKIRR